jgi:hypothetical protein
MADMPDAETGTGAGARVFHVDGHRLVDAAAPYCGAEGGVAPHLFGHRKNLEAMAVGFRANCARIRFHGVAVDHISVGRYLPLLMQRYGRFDQARIAAAQHFEKHPGTSISESFRGASARSPRE